MKLVNLLLGSWTAVVLLFLYIPIVILAVSSFNDAQPRDEKRDAERIANSPAFTTLARMRFATYSAAPDAS